MRIELDIVNESNEKIIFSAVQDPDGIAIRITKPDGSTLDHIWTQKEADTIQKLLMALRDYNLSRDFW